MERPRPVPSGFVVKKGSKILGRSSFAIPVPLSLNEMLSRRCGFFASGSTRLSTRTVPPCGMACMALSRMFTNT